MYYIFTYIHIPNLHIPYRAHAHIKHNSWPDHDTHICNVEPNSGLLYNFILSLVYGLHIANFLRFNGQR